MLWGEHNATQIYHSCNNVLVVVGWYLSVPYIIWIYRVYNNYYDEKFSRDPIFMEAHLERFCNLIFMNGRSRVAPSTISVKLCLLLHICCCSNLIRRKSYEKPASNRSIVLKVELSRHREMARESHVIEARGICVEEAQPQWTGDHVK